MVKGRVLAVHEDQVTVDNGALTGPWDLAYEWLILAPGSTYAEGPIKAFCHSLEERQNIIQVGRAIHYLGEEITMYFCHLFLDMSTLCHAV